MPRKVLVVIQFTVSVTLVIGTVVVYEQIQFARNRPIGYNRDGLITVSMNDPSIRKDLDVLRNDWVNSGVVTSTALSSSPLTDIWNTTSGYNWPGKDPNVEGSFVMNLVTPSYGKTIGWTVVEGRDFSADIASDTIDAIIINRAAARYMGIEHPVGQQLIDVDQFGGPKWSKTIIGVVDDVIAMSPYYTVQQAIYYYRPEMFGQIQLRINHSISAGEALPKIKSIYNKLLPASYFEYSFVDEDFGKKFSQEERVGKLAGVFTILAIAISCLGLFGLAQFVVQQRTKEIGIRKVMGASVTAVWQMLSKDFVILIVISCVIATPVGYYLMNSWLARFEYRTGISIWVFVITSAAAVLVTLTTISYQSVRSATSNPVKSLRSE